ncbi:MAG TPA: acetylxylan esterase [Acidimicrobiales bacterium]|nr:acetylxylan esterase [Acidimicrobiales bacterium]
MTAESFPGASPEAFPDAFPEAFPEGGILAASPPGRNFSPWRWFERRLAAAVANPVDPCPVDRPDELAAWRRRGARRLRNLLGPLPAPVPLRVEVRSSVDCGTYRRDLIVYDSEEEMSVPAYLLVPHTRTRPGPAVLAQHGHGPGKDEVCGLVPGQDGAARNDYAHQLAQRGYVVLAPDLRTFGERADWNPPNLYACDLSHMHGTLLGYRLLALDLWDLARGLDLLVEHPLVDRRRLGMVGLSQGGTCTLFLAAWDRRVRAAVVSGYLNRWATCAALPWNMCGSQTLPGVVSALDHLELGALVAPRSLLVESGTEDAIFPSSAAVEVSDQLRRVYQALGVADRMEIDVFEGGHGWHGERAYPFLARWLGPGREDRSN